MKIKHILATLSLSLVLGFGAFVGTKSFTETKEAKAATNGRFSILINDNCDWKYGHFLATYSGSGEIRITPDSDLGDLDSNGYTWQQIGDTWYAVLSMEVDTTTFTYDNFYFRKVNPNNHSDEWGNSGWILSPAKVKNGTSNTIVVSSGPSFTQDWGNYWKITTYFGKTSYASLDGTTKKAYLKSAGYTFMPDNPDAPTGYEFVGWYKDTSFTQAWTSSSKPTADTILYAKYEAVSCSFISGSDVVGDTLDFNVSNKQFEGVITLEANEKFAIRKTVGSTPTDYHTLDSGLSASMAVEDGNYVKIINAGTYIVYFKSNNEIWIEVAGASLVAYAYAGYFLTNVGCDSQGTSLPSGWANVKARYESTALTNDARDYIYNFDLEGTRATKPNDDIVQMLDRYNWACKVHPTLDRFVKNSSGTARTIPSANVSINPIVSNSTNDVVALVIIVSSISLIALGGFFFIRKRKEDR